MVFNMITRIVTISLIGTAFVVAGFWYLFIEGNPETGEPIVSVGLSDSFRQNLGGRTSAPVSTSVQERPSRNFSDPTRTLVVLDSEGEEISVRNFIASSTPEQIEGEVGERVFVLLGGNEDDYVVTYTEFDQSFSITLLAEPIGEHRKEAEMKLQEFLGIDAVEICFLRIGVFMPWWVNDEFSGYNVGISGCANATVLP